MKKLLKLMPHAQAHVILKDDDTKILVSYDTPAAKISAKGWLTVTCWASPTTRRHIAAFMDEYIFHIQTKSEQSKADTGSYQTAKALFDGNLKMNISTGEVRDLDAEED